MIAVTVLSAVVYGHHMYITGMNPLLGQSFMLLTLVISVPADGPLHQLAAHHLEGLDPAHGADAVRARHGVRVRRRRADRPLPRHISTDLYLHDTMFVVGHFHLTMAAASFLGASRRSTSGSPRCSAAT